MRVQIVTGFERHRHEQPRLNSEERELGRQDTYDAVALAIHRQVPADDQRIGAEAPAPQAVAQNRDPMRAPLLVAGKEPAPENGRSAERAEESG